MVPPTRRRFGERLREFHEEQEEDASEFSSLFSLLLPYTVPVIVAILVFVGGAILSLGTWSYVAGAVLLLASVGLALRRRRPQSLHE